MFKYRIAELSAALGALDLLPVAVRPMLASLATSYIKSTCAEKARLMVEAREAGKEVLGIGRLALTTLSYSKTFNSIPMKDRKIGVITK